MTQAEVAIFADLDSAKSHLDHQAVDLLLLDLNLRGRDGFDLLRDCAARAFHTIVVSANTDRALEAFEFGVLDFVPKPVTRERLQKALERLTTDAPPTNPLPRYFSVRTLGKLELIEMDQVNYIKGAGKYSELVLRDGREVLHDKSLDRLNTLLSPHFHRIHKSYLVPMRHLAKLEVLGGGKYRAVLRSGVRLPVGRSRYQELAALLL